MKILLTAEQLSEGVERLAQEVAEFYQRRPLTILGVLTGAIVLVSDLIRRVDLPLRIGFVQASSYRGPATSKQSGARDTSQSARPGMDNVGCPVVQQLAQPPRE